MEGIFELIGGLIGAIGDFLVSITASVSGDRKKEDEIAFEFNHRASSGRVR